MVDPNPGDRRALGLFLILCILVRDPAPPRARVANTATGAGRAGPRKGDWIVRKMLLITIAVAAVVISGFVLANRIVEG